MGPLFENSGFIKTAAPWAGFDFFAATTIDGCHASEPESFCCSWSHFKKNEPVFYPPICLRLK
jgi:hypothetical protein